MGDARVAHNHHSNQGNEHQEEKDNVDEPGSAAKPQTAPVRRYAPQRAVPEALREVEERGYSQTNPDPKK
ncbi:MAG: hypothetical protein DMG37_14225 [Acidobacteria bacterium]|nr:MAG: hypothetical protein DMG37_14225 [Acidobacteriota bacterium]